MESITREKIHLVKVLTQQAAFPEEYKVLTNKESSLLSFNPYMDGKGILRVSG